MIKWITVVSLCACVANVYSDICPDESICPGTETCCPKSGSQNIGDFGCCPYSSGVCCVDHESCCPPGNICIAELHICIPFRQSLNGTSISYTSSAKLTRRPGTNDLASNTVKREKTPCGYSSCSDNSTCCFDMGCCPLPEAVCCDKTHCCPRNTRCEFTTKECVPTSSSLVSYRKVLNLAKGMETPCASGSCPDVYTCCHNAYCCPLTNAVCCPNKLHCCPEHHKCDLRGGKCHPPEDSLTSFIKIQSFNPSVKRDKPCGHSSCPDNSTCCFDVGCCPLPDAVCCNDELHCCPQNTRCALGNKCLSSDTFQRTSEKIITRMQPKDIPCGAGTCPDLATCCGGISCCPVSSGVCCSDNLHCCPAGYNCCSDNLHCCPQGTTCDPTGERCVLLGNAFTFYKAILSFDHMQPKNKTCGSGTCEEYYTCCFGESCCPLPNAVCCADHQHCCPHGATCNIREGRCDL